MDTGNTRVPLPYKLTSEMSRRSWKHHTVAFQSLVDAVALVCPGIVLESQRRYSAFYRNGQIIVYVEPQSSRVLFGFFADYIHTEMEIERISMQRTAFPDWNTSKGGLIGFSLHGREHELTPVVADIAYLVIQSFKRSHRRR